MNKGCKHGVSWNTHCDKCEIIGLTEKLEWMKPMVKKAENRLKELLAIHKGEQDE